MKQLFAILVLLVLILGLNNWIIEPESQINDKSFFPKTLKDQSKFNPSIQEPKSSLFNNASCYNKINWSFEAYDARLYNYTEFDLPAAFLTGTYSDQGVDTDGDGRFDELIINIEINFTKEARYKIEIVLRDMYSETSITKVKRSDWTEGTRNISFSIDAYALYPSIPRVTLYVLEFIKVYDSNNTLISQSHQNSTLNYYYTEFDFQQIIIDGNNDFNRLIKDEKWLGDGTPSNPYIIEGLTLNGPKSIDLISIKNTTAYFNITNCLLNGGTTGITLYNVENAHISNNLIQNNNEGIYLRFSDNNVFTGNTIITTDNGIRLGSNNLNFPDTVNNNTIINNVFYNNSHSGVWCAYESRSNLIKWNDFKDNGQSMDSQAMDNGLYNTFSFNHWYNWTSDKPYLIIGFPGTVDSNPLPNPHHLSKPRIIYPNGGEKITATFVIDWAPSKDDLGHDITYSIYYSSNNGSTWILLNIQFLSSFRLEIHKVPLGSTFLVRVIAMDSFGFYTMDSSDQPFTIQAPPPLPFSIRLVLFLLICSLLFVVIKKKAN